MLPPAATAAAALALLLDPARSPFAAACGQPLLLLALLPADLRKGAEGFGSWWSSSSILASISVQHPDEECKCAIHVLLLVATDCSSVSTQKQGQGPGCAQVMCVLVTHVTHAHTYTPGADLCQPLVCLRAICCAPDAVLQVQQALLQACGAAAATTTFTTHRGLIKSVWRQSGACIHDQLQGVHA